MEKIKFAIVGCGNIGKRHVQHILSYGKLVAVCDTDAGRARLLAEEYGVPFFTSIEDLIDQGLPMDVISICTPNGLHAHHAKLALHSGHHAMVEKPMALKAVDCKEMMEAAYLTNKELFLVVQNRFNPPVVAIKKALESNAFGKISSIQLSCVWNRDDAYYQHSWKGSQSLDGGTLFTQFSHFIDLLYWFFGDIEVVSAITRNANHQHSTEIEDCGVVMLKFADGMIGSIHFTVNSFARNREGSLTIIGKDGMAKIGGEYLNTIEYQQFRNHQLENLPVTSMANDYGNYKGSMSNHDRVYANLVDHLVNGVPYYVNAKDGLKTVDIIERIYSAAIGK